MSAKAKSGDSREQLLQLAEALFGERGVPHFQKLAIIWTIVGGTAIAAMLPFVAQLY